MYKQGRYARSIALSILAIEEQGKMFWILAAGSQENDRKRSRIWLRFKNHPMKTNEFRKATGSYLGEGKWGPPGSEPDHGLSTEKRVEALKQRSLYVGAAYRKQRWLIPSAMATRADAQLVLFFAKSRTARVPALDSDRGVVPALLSAMRDSFRSGEVDRFDEFFASRLRKASAKGLGSRDVAKRISDRAKGMVASDRIGSTRRA